MEYKFTTENFETEVLQAELPVLVDLYADWCGPCKRMAPIVEEIATEYDGKLKVGKCNIDENMQIAQKYRVASIPTFLLFKGGEVADTLIGGDPDALYDKIDAILG
ncbi:MAG: thioredoxin [Lachnospiraceae bacterium]|nr:thioredoxin [Lachnospiraceae bacterium]